MLEHRPTARWNHETRRADPVTEEGAPPPSPAYTGSQDTVKGRMYGVVVPHGLRTKAEAAGVDVELVLRAAGIRGLRDAVKVARGEVEPDPTGNSKQSALARAQLGALIQKHRTGRQLSRRDLTFRIWNQLDTAGIDRVHGWGTGQVQQWEMGRSAPRQIDVVADALRLTEDEAAELHQLWAVAKRGVGEVPEIPLPPANPVLSGTVSDFADHEHVSELIGEAAGGLRALLDEAAAEE